MVLGELFSTIQFEFFSLNVEVGDTKSNKLVDQDQNESDAYKRTTKKIMNTSK